MAVSARHSPVMVCSRCQQLEWTNGRILEEAPSFIRGQADVLKRIGGDYSSLFDKGSSDFSTITSRVTAVHKKMKDLISGIDVIRDSGTTYNPQLEKIRTFAHDILRDSKNLNIAVYNVKFEKKCLTHIQGVLGLSLMTSVAVALINALSTYHNQRVYLGSFIVYAATFFCGTVLDRTRSDDGWVKKHLPNRLDEAVKRFDGTEPDAKSAVAAEATVQANSG